MGWQSPPPKRKKRKIPRGKWNSKTKPKTHGWKN
jgi:hypothetical protein